MKKVKDALSNLPCPELKKEMKRIQESVKALPLHAFMIKTGLPLAMMGPIKILISACAEQEFVNGTHFGSGMQIKDNEYHQKIRVYFEKVIEEEEAGEKE